MVRRFAMPNNHIAFENKDYYIEIGLNISFYRKREGMTQEALAEKSGVSRSHLSAIEAPNIIRPFSMEIIFKYRFSIFYIYCKSFKCGTLQAAPIQRVKASLLTAGPFIVPARFQSG